MKFAKKAFFFATLAIVWQMSTACSYNSIQRADENVNAAYSEILNQYKRRADLVPNLVKVVKQYASHEKEVLVGVTEARSKATSIQATEELVNNKEKFMEFQKAQGDFSQALSRLMMVTENYPNLKADTQFRDLQAQLEGTENRIAVARKRYIDSVKEYNIMIRSFPANITAMIFDYQTKPQFSVENEEQIKEAPEVNFD